MCRIFLVMVTFALLLAPPEASASSRSLRPFLGEGELQAYLQKHIQARLETQARERAEQERIRLAREKLAPGSTSTGSIAGATAAGATVTIENKDRGFRREIVADANGNYRAGSLPTGSYDVTAAGETRTVVVTIGGTASGLGLEMVMVQGAAIDAGPGDSESITNVQTAGVDEGGIVKRVGDYLVVLRRGRLFTVEATTANLRLASVVDAYDPSITSDWDWYDEMLISGRTVVVIGYSYSRGGTELGLFDLGNDGSLSHRATYHMRSSDYFSSRNYASRLVGNTLILYAPMTLDFDKPMQEMMPAMRRWRSGHGADSFKRMLPAQKIYRSGLGDWQDLALHTVTRCDLSTPELICEASAVLGPNSSTFYVSGEAVYVWMTQWPEDEISTPPPASVLRMPLDGSPPAALRVQGSPIDQLSFLERDGHLNVLVGADAGGQRMWRAEGKTGGLALMRVPLDRFGDSRAATHRADYRALPAIGDDWVAHNRFIGDWLLYAGSESDDHIYGLRYADRKPALRILTGHGTERIEALAEDALVVGNHGKDLEFTTIRLDADARIAGNFVQPASGQSEERSHGFFYRQTGIGAGMLGLPVELDEPESLVIQYLRNQDLSLRDAGQLASRSAANTKDGCKASCWDWYGGSRPIFLGDRVYALIGYELVEGAMVDDRLQEIRRVNFTPAPGKSAH
jgi:hypothetical protein